MSRRNKAGYVYLFKCPRNGVKIGRSINPEIRVKAFQFYPFSAEIICYYFFKDCEVAEKKAHDFFTKKRIGGEWFRFSKKDIERAQSFIAEAALCESAQ